MTILRPVKCPVSNHTLFEVEQPGQLGVAVQKICPCKRRVRVAPDLSTQVIQERETAKTR